MAFENRHSKWLKSDKVRGWYEDMREKSALNADVNLRNLGLFCERMKTDPESILEMAKNGNAGKELKQKFKEYVRELKKQGKAGSYIVKYKTVLNHWIRFNDIPFRIDDKIDEAEKYRTVFHEKVPSQSELLAIIRNATKRGRVIIALMAFTGVRPESIGNYEGTDGLRLGDIEGFNPKTLEFEIVPAMITVRDSLSKTRDEYFTLIGDEGLTYIKEYLKVRAEEGEILTAQSPLVTFRWGKDTKRDMPRTLLVTREVRDAMRKSGFNDMRPYVLRRYFASALSIGETRRFITHEWRQFIMGHKGDMESHYVSAKGNLNEDLKKTVKDSYSKCLPLLETSAKAMSEEDKDREFKLRALKMDGFTDEEIVEKGLLEMDNEELLRARREKLFGTPNGRQDYEESARLDRQLMSKSKNGSRQKSIPILAIEAYLNQGFEFVAKITDDKAIVRLPS